MIRTVILLLLLTWLISFPNQVQAAEAPSLSVLPRELGLEGEVQNVDPGTGVITILASAFSTSGGTKQIAPAKTKTLVTTGQTRFFDERTQRDFELEDVLVGRHITVVGIDSGTGQPLVARVVTWRSPLPAQAPDGDTPKALIDILPTSQTVDGVTVQIFDAGFKSEKNLFPWGRESNPTFFLAYRASTPAGGGVAPTDAEFDGEGDEGDNDQEHTNAWWKRVRFIGLTGPDGQTIQNKTAGKFGQQEIGHALTFEGVDPRWKSVTANWEVKAPDAPENASGKFAGAYEIQGAAPTRLQPRVEPKTVIQTAHDTIYTLQSVVCDFKKGTTTFQLDIEKPADVPDAHVSTYPSAIHDGKGTTFVSHSIARANAITIQCSQLPAPGSQMLSLELTVEESAPSWKDAKFYRRISQRIPVASIIKAKPPTKVPQGFASVYREHNEVAEVTLEEKRRSDMSWWGTVWMRPQISLETVKTLVKNVVEFSGGKAVAADGKEFPITSTFDEEFFFHADGSPAEPDAQATEIGIDFPDDAPSAPLQLHLESTQTKQVGHEWKTAGLSIPSMGKTQSLPANPGSGGLSLEKISLVEEKKALDITHRLGGKPMTGAGLVFVFKVQRVIPDSVLVFRGFRLDDTDYSVGNVSSSVWNGDILTGEKDSHFWSLVIPAPDKLRPPSAQLHLLEVGPQEVLPPLVIKNFVVKPETDESAVPKNAPAPLQ